MSAMISIDFGNSYTKVGIRSAETENSKLLEDSSLKLQEGNFCVPTLASRIVSNGEEEWRFGTQVTEQPSDLSGLKVFRNWKPRFFDGVKATPRKKVIKSVVGALATGEGMPESVEGIPATVLDSLRTALGHLGEENLAIIEQAILKIISNSPAQAESEETDLDMKFIGKGFFHWLREELVEPYCQKHSLGAVSQIPARVTIPSFGIAATKAELLIKEIMEEAGWCLDSTAPVLAEPLANAIGAFTEGRNAIAPHVHEPLYSMMFRNTGLLEKYKDHFHKRGDRYCWTLIVDLGGYTTDFAMIGIDLDGIETRLEGEADSKPIAAHESVPEGVSNALDPRLRAMLSEEKRQAIDALLQDPDQHRLETFHRRVYGPIFRQYVMKNARIGVGKEKEMIQDCVRVFAEGVADRAEDFLETYQYDQIDDLILTGGGCMIFEVRRALYSRLRKYGTKKNHMYWEEDQSKDDFCQNEIHELENTLARGATALGGGSVYFDFA